MASGCAQSLFNQSLLSAAKPQTMKPNTEIATSGNSKPRPPPFAWKTRANDVPALPTSQPQNTSSIHGLAPTKLLFALSYHQILSDSQRPHATTSPHTGTAVHQETTLRRVALASNTPYCIQTPARSFSQGAHDAGHSFHGCAIWWRTHTRAHTQTPLSVRGFQHATKSPRQRSRLGLNRQPLEVFHESLEAHVVSLDDLPPTARAAPGRIVGRRRINL